MNPSRWWLYVGLVITFLSSLYLGRIAQQERLMSTPGWEDTGYGVVSD